ncbi:MAG: acetylglutamate kinase [Vulcanimicrobiaceae bacterium]
MNEYSTPLAPGPIVVKYGGNAMTLESAAADVPESDPILSEIAELWAAGTRIVLVHGGGPEIDRALTQRGITTQRIDGMRVTDAPTLETTEAVLCGTINKRLVRDCTALGIPAAGISGQDGGTLVAQKLRPEKGTDLGYVGEVVACDPRLILTLLDAGFLPVVAPLAIAANAAHAYNINADLAAAAISGAIKANAFILITNVPRVLRDPQDPASGIDHLTLAQARAFAQSPACGGSMKPKIHAAIHAVALGSRAAYIAGSGYRTIWSAVELGHATILD